nr:D-alanyl-D-alanine carboxypeptidase family protein [Helcococcus sueciensis]
MKKNNQTHNNKLQRLINREKRRKQAKVKMVAIGLIATISVASVYTFISRQHNAQADSAKLITNIQETINEDTTYSVKGEQKYSDKLLSYKKVSIDADVYEEVINNPKVNFKVSNGEYIKYYGQENGWAKIKKNGDFGYIQAIKLQDVKENELVVKDGVLLDSIKNTFPQDFDTVFSVDVENSALVMFEAMKRAGMNIGVSRTTIDDQEINKAKNQKYAVPDYTNHTLRTGESIELEIPNTSDNIDFKKTIQGEWLTEHAYEYGFILRYPEGKEDITGFFANDRIYRYVGVEIAKEMHDKNLSFEEYFNITEE